jgi:hypothetical protein
MIVKINDKEYDSRKTPIFLALSNEEKEQIANMRDQDKIFASFPSEENIKDIMSEFYEEHDNELKSNWE